MGRGTRRPAGGFTVELFSPLAGRYDTLCEVLSMGQNRRWRRRMVDRIAPGRPNTVLDVASGTAGVAIQLARRTGARVIGFDLTLPMLHEGRRRIEAAALGDRIDLVGGRAEQLPFPDGAFDALTFTYLLRYVDDPETTLAELARVLRPGAPMASLEFLAPPNPILRAAWWGYTRLVLPVAGWLAGGASWWKVGKFLGPSITGHYRRYPVSWTTEAWESAGFVNVGVRQMSLGGGLVMWGRRSGG